MLTVSEENYLKSIFRLSRESDNKITLTAIAETLAHNTASVIDMIKKLSDKKLISYDKVSGVKLRELGSNLALQIIRKHRLWEVFLHDKLDYKWDEVHDIAEQLEHVGGNDLPDRLEKFLRFPKYDPHGDPIPNSNGRLAVLKSKPLGETALDKKVRITGVSDNSADFLRYLNKQNIQLNDAITIKEIHDFDRSVLVELKGKKEVYLSAEAAKKIFVE